MAVYFIVYDDESTDYISAKTDEEVIELCGKLSKISRTSTIKVKERNDIK